METTFTVRGMTCEHCERRVTTELLALDTVRTASADHKTGTVRIVAKSVPRDEVVRAAVEEAGYELVEP